MAWHELRASTHDVDSAERLDPAFQAVVAQVGARHGLAPKWINSAASRFLPVGFDPSGGEVILDHPKLVVLGADLDQVLLMKIFAGRESDTDDIRHLWSLTSFTTIAEVRRVPSRLPARRRRPVPRVVPPEDRGRRQRRLMADL